MEKNNLKDIKEYNIDKNSTVAKRIMRKTGNNIAIVSIEENDKDKTNSQELKMVDKKIMRNQTIRENTLPKTQTKMKKVDVEQEVIKQYEMKEEETKKQEEPKTDKNMKKEIQEEKKDNNTEIKEETQISLMKEKDINKTKEENEEKNYNNDKNDDKLEKTIECTALKEIKQKSFFVLVLKFVIVFFTNIFKATLDRLKILCRIIKDFFGDRAEDIDRKIKELKDEAIIKEKKRKLEYEKYNTKRIYKDLERAELYKERANNRINTEKYFEDKIEEEKINNKVIISKNEVIHKEEKKNKEINKTANLYSSSKKNRIEKKRLEILELKKRKKAEKEKQKDKEIHNLFLDNKSEQEFNNAEINIEELSNEFEDEDLFKNNKDVIYNMDEDIFNEFGSEDEFNEENDLEINNIIDSVDKEEIKIPNSLPKDEVKVKETYKAFEKKDNVREINEVLKDQLLDVIDPTETETIKNMEIKNKKEHKKIEKKEENLVIGNQKNINDDDNSNIKLSTVNSIDKDIITNNQNNINDTKDIENQKTNINKNTNNIKEYENSNTNKSMNIDTDTKILGEINTNNTNKMFKINNKKKNKSDFDSELYTNKFMRNIIDFDTDNNIPNRYIPRQQQEKMDKNIVVESMNDKQEINTYSDINNLKDSIKYNVSTNQNNIINNEKMESNNIDEFEITYNNKKDILVENIEKSSKKEVVTNDKEDVNTLRARIKDVASSINLSLSALPETIKKKRESKNRIKKNQIFSTSFNKKGKRK